jgi:hypothetical protein
MLHPLRGVCDVISMVGPCDQCFGLVFILPLYALPSCSKFSTSIPLPPFPNNPPTHVYSTWFYLIVSHFILYNLILHEIWCILYIVFSFHWFVNVTGVRDTMPWKNCHGYLLLLLILLIVALIVAAQLLWQYFLPSRLVAALDKRHLPPNNNTLLLICYIPIKSLSE